MFLAGRCSPTSSTGWPPQSTIIMLYIALPMTGDGITAAAVICVLIVSGIAVYEELVELRRRHWKLYDIGVTPLRVVFNVLTWPKYISYPIATISLWLGTAGATPMGRAGIFLCAVWIVSIYVALLHISAAILMLETASKDLRWKQAIFVALLIYLGRVGIGGRADEADERKRFDVSYVKPIKLRAYKEITIVILLEMIYIYSRF